jgi:hypothetical protein
MVPVAPVEVKISWDISELVDVLLLASHCSVKPIGTLTVVEVLVPTA